MITINKSISFPAAHRLMGSQELSKNIHGHNFRVEIQFIRNELDDTYLHDVVTSTIEVNTVMDKFREWVSINLDHSFIICLNDKKVIKFAESMTMKVFTFPYPPSIDNLVVYLRDMLDTFLDGDNKIDKQLLHLNRVRLYDSNSNYAEAS